MTTTAEARKTGVTLGMGVRDFFVHGVLQPRVLRKVYPGIMHALIFWGMTIQILGTAISLMQIQLFIPFVELGELFPVGNAYFGFELVMDLAGVAILIGALMALFRRLILRPKTLESRWDDYYAIGMLFLIPILGFTTEGMRFVATSPEWSNWSPMGNMVAGLMRGLGLTPAGAESVHYGFYWAHIVTGIAFAGSIPFTKLRHLVTAPLHVIFRSREKPSALPPIENIEEVEILGAGQAAEFTSQQLLSFDACLNCGRCEAVCPADFSGMVLSPRKVVQSLRSTLFETLIEPNDKEPEDILADKVKSEATWACTTCGACITTCPVFINPAGAIVDMRRHHALMTGDMPGSAALALRNIERQGNPWGMPASDRLAWIEGVDVRILEPGEETDVLFFVGCALAYDDRNKKAAKAFVRLMQQAGIDFAILGDAEACCGETARRLGNEYIFQVLAEQNIEVLGEYRFKHIVAQCTHCFNTLKNEYPQFGGEYQVLHYSEFLKEVAGRLPLSREQSNGTNITYHDSCYLGRYNQIYNEPRMLLDMAGVPRVEMERRGENSFCCGGGGGQMWMETDPNTRISHRRLDDVLNVQADIVATACPYCLLMLDDAIRTRALGEQVEVMDVAEILASRLTT